MKDKEIIERASNRLNSLVDEGIKKVWDSPIDTGTISDLMLGILRDHLSTREFLNFCVAILNYRRRYLGINEEGAGFQNSLNKGGDGLSGFRG